MSSCCGSAHHNKQEEKHDEKAHLDEKHKKEHAGNKKGLFSKLLG